MHLRRATVDDVPALVALNPHVHDLHVAAQPDRYRVTVPEEVAAHYATLLQDAGTEAWIASVDGEDLGYVVVVVTDRPQSAFTHASRFLLVDQIAVHAEARQRGIGRALMDHVRAIAKEAGCARIALDVSAFNEEALAFYERLGFTPLQHRLALPL